MNGRSIRLLALLLALLLTLCGCVRGNAVPAMRETPAPTETSAPAETPAPTETAAPAETPEPEDDPNGQRAEEEKRIETVARGEEMPLFRDIPYERPDLDELDALIEKAIEAANSGAPYDEVEALLDDCFLYYYHYDTMCTLADIRSCLDLTDEYYAGEYLWCSENYVLADESIDDLYYACAASPMAAELEEKYFWEGFVEEYSDESESMYNDETVALMQEESNLVAEYRALSAAPEIEFRGKIEPLDELLVRLSGPSYNQAVTAYYEQYNERFADIFIRMVSVREKLAAAMGYDSYEEMRYSYGFGRDYTPADAEVFLQDIKTWMVPVYEDLANSPLLYRVRADALDESRLRDILRVPVSEFGGSVAEAFDFMLRYELCDLKADSRKANMSFETYLNDYEAPFVFLNAAGTTEDILTFAHEFGHFSDAYVNENSYESIDLAEVYSQAMEYLVLSRLGGQLTEAEVDTLAKLKMIDTVEMYVEQAAFAEFEHRIYAIGADGLTAEVINSVSRDVCREYGFYNEYYDAFFSLSWVDIPHYFEQGFYVISYPVSNDLAMQFYALDRENHGAGLEKYLECLDRDFSGLMGLVDAGGLNSPFSAGRMKAAAALAREVLGL